MPQSSISSLSKPTVSTKPTSIVQSGSWSSATTNSVSPRSVPPPPPPLKEQSAAQVTQGILSTIKENRDTTSKNLIPEEKGLDANMLIQQRKTLKQREHTHNSASPLTTNSNDEDMIQLKNFCDIKNFFELQAYNQGNRGKWDKKFPPPTFPKPNVSSASPKNKETNGQTGQNSPLTGEREYAVIYNKISNNTTQETINQGNQKNKFPPPILPKPKKVDAGVRNMELLTEKAPHNIMARMRYAISKQLRQLLK